MTTRTKPIPVGTRTVSARYALAPSDTIIVARIDAKTNTHYVHRFTLGELCEFFRGWTAVTEENRDGL